jgi:hypothetical protein
VGMIVARCIFEDQNNNFGIHILRALAMEILKMATG